MRTVKQNIEVVNGIDGLSLVDHFVLPTYDWWKHYYNSIEKRISLLRNKYHDKIRYQAELDKHQQELDLFARFSDCYGYVFFIIQKISTPPKN
jgi:hypothetical protein